MYITNWLAKKDGNEGLAFPSEFGNGNIRIYGNVYGHPDFRRGEFVRTGIIESYHDGKIKTVYGEEYTLKCEAKQYLSYLKAVESGQIIVKKWNVDNGIFIGQTLDGRTIRGTITAQSIEFNVCEMEDGKALFIDWLSRSPEFNTNHECDNFLVFCTERCMPQIFGKHYKLFHP